MMNNNGASYHQPQQGYVGSGGSGGGGAHLRRRNVEHYNSDGYSFNGNSGGGGGGSNSNGDSSDNKYKKSMRRKMVKNLDFFPKVESDLMVKTERGGLVTLVGYGIVFFLCLNELFAHWAISSDTIESVVVDTSLSTKMNVNINISFPAISCVDLHLDVMDVAGDSQMNIEDTLIKRRINKRGLILQTKSSVTEVKVNQAHHEETKMNEALHGEVPDDYCGPCYGAADDEDQCCNDCDTVVKAYKKKRWNEDAVLKDAEQCIREGKKPKNVNTAGPRHITTGEGCNLSGHMHINRVNGNFHMALGEGVVRGGRHIHLFIPEDAPKFNTTHTIHELTFGPKVSESEHGDLEGVTKVTTEENGETGLFQYYIKVVPTVYKSRDPGTPPRETNRYFFTDRYRPLWADGLEDGNFDHVEHRNGREHVGHHIAGAAKHSHGKAQHHHHMNSILPGVFFIYEIYPFAIEVEEKTVPFSHFLIRIMALIGGIFTIVGWTESVMCVRDKNRRG